MKLLKIEDSSAQFLDEGGSYKSIDLIGKADLLRLTHQTLHDDGVEFDDYNEEGIKNQAHQVIYRSVVGKLQELRLRRQEFIDESARLFIEDYQRYRDDLNDQPKVA